MTALRASAPLPAWRRRPSSAGFPPCKHVHCERWSRSLLRKAAPGLQATPTTACKAPSGCSALGRSVGVASASSSSHYPEPSMQPAAGAAAVVQQSGAARLAAAARRRRGQQRHLVTRVVSRYAGGAGAVPPAAAAAAPPLPPAQQAAAAQRPPVPPRRRVGVSIPPPAPIAPPGSSTLQSLTAAAGVAAGGAASNLAPAPAQQPFTVNVQRAAALSTPAEVLLSRSQVISKEVITRQAGLSMPLWRDARHVCALLQGCCGC